MDVGGGVVKPVVTPAAARIITDEAKQLFVIIGDSSSMEFM